VGAKNKWGEQRKLRKGRKKRGVKGEKMIMSKAKRGCQQKKPNNRRNPSDISGNYKILGGSRKGEILRETASQ